MRGHNVNMIYLGNFADVDTDESNMNAGNAADLLGGCSAPSSADIQANGTNSNNNNNIIDDAIIMAPRVSTNAAIVCFTRGTQIMTPDGPVPVGQLRVGQNVVTLDRACNALHAVLAASEPRR